MGSSTKLAVATSQRAGTPNSLRVGTVVSVATTGVVVNIGGGNVLCGMIGGAGAGVAPGAVVSVFKQGDSWQVQGMVSGPGQGIDTPAAPSPSMNALIVPPANTANPGAITGATAGTFTSGLVVASGEIYVGGNASGAGFIQVVLPQGHLCEIRVANLVSVTTVAATTPVYNVREGTTVAGALRAQGVPFLGAVGFGYPVTFSGYMIGDGLIHSLGLFASVAGGTGAVTVTKNAYNWFFGVIDWGDGSTVRAI